MITPFRIAVPQADLDDLADRLARTRWPDELPDAGWDYGFPLARLKELAEHWRTRYDWRAHEARLNELPHYTTEIDGQHIHFVHVRAADPGALPLVLTHGWPGSFLEFLDMIEPLSQRFHLVIPSIPGFAFSGPTRERGWDIVRVARAWAELMHRLGYERYGAHGGDFGAGISLALGGLDAARVVGVHLNYLPTRPDPDAGLVLSRSDEARLEKIRRLMADRPPYQALQALTPQTIGYALTDSPVAQLVWIAERFAQWTDPRTPIDDERLLTDVSLYWLTATAGSSARLTRETPRGAAPCPVPVGVAVLPHDITQSVRPLAERLYDIRQWTELDRGGHFAAMEVPDLLAADIAAFFGTAHTPSVPQS
ncbi:epoxide hydrolase family protein [Dactylosporangium matsuzakiense]|uniref:Microsomal epoxide hydrolase n=1 Tax=Dactylosporangium matsuzakiense TaxID=53360 RepID=A0A9W6NSB9_9ACTN|nr:epoxide hydrolase family protein [Dactylosporangium matsuzakiense]UWZ41430.1 epoxide hydrolase [Dactylosporangium matsuzakiense]GLL06987.1 microsomal epoxide hydrolase [Dactylosporangium matsuzakiense]